jgi:hypothetical protein
VVPAMVVEKDTHSELELQYEAQSATEETAIAFPMLYAASTFIYGRQL